MQTDQWTVNIDLVFNNNVYNYQRSKYVTFLVGKYSYCRLIRRDNNKQDIKKFTFPKTITQHACYSEWKFHRLFWATSWQPLLDQWC